MATRDEDDSSRRRSDDGRRWARTNQVLDVTWVEGGSNHKEEKETIDDCQEDQDRVLGLREGLIYR